MTSHDPGTLVISLDFELHWGVRDHTSVAGYKENLLGVRQAIPGMLDLFTRYNVHATWATVGFLFFDTKANLVAHLPERRPDYTKPELSPYAEIDRIGASEQDDPFHYGASLLRLIQETPGQEVGTHTFSHYFCLEGGQALEDFEADLMAAKGAAEQLGIELKSLIFPRNQFNPAYLAACRRAGLMCYRGNQRSSLYAASDTMSDKNLIKRGLRLVDAYLPITGVSARSLAEIATTASGADEALLYDVAASRFLRPYSPALRLLEPLRLRRIEREMAYAARNGLIYHLWWHPHNFGANTPANIAALERLLRHFEALRREQGMASRTMAEIADILRAVSASRPLSTPGTVMA